MPPKGSELVDIEVTLQHQTEKAWLVRSCDTAKEAWVPKSVGEMEPDKGLYYILTVPTDWAIDKGLV